MKLFKSVAFVILSVALLSFSVRSNGNPPQKVKDAFAKKFPTAKSVSWDKESDTEWEAEFKMNKTAYSANFLSDGTWKETEHKINKKDIPSAVKNTLMTTFSGYEIEEAEISETSTGTVYEFEIEKGESDMEVAINLQGDVVKKELKSEDDDQDND